MKLLYAVLLFLSNNAVAQWNFRAGTAVYVDLNLYHWYQRPNTIGTSYRSVGQAVNILPSAAVCFWVGNPKHWFVLAEGKAEFFPYSFDLRGKNGFGALSFAALGKTLFPLSSRHGVCPYMSFGGGVQWNKTELYVPPSHTPFFVTFVGEIELGLGSGWGAGDNSTRLLGFFLRSGFAAHGAVSFNVGIRIGNFFGTKDNKTPPPIQQQRPKEPTFQTK